MSIKESSSKKLQDKTAKISILGLGYSGLPLPAVFAESGFDMVSIDLVELKVETLTESLAPFVHPGICNGG